MSCLTRPNSYFSDSKRQGASTHSQTNRLETHIKLLSEVTGNLEVVSPIWKDFNIVHVIKVEKCLKL